MSKEEKFRQWKLLLSKITLIETSLAGIIMAYPEVLTFSTRSEGLAFSTRSEGLAFSTRSEVLINLSDIDLRSRPLLSVIDPEIPLDLSQLTIQGPLHLRVPQSFHDIANSGRIHLRRERLTFFDVVKSIQAYYAKPLNKRLLARMKMKEDLLGQPKSTLLDDLIYIRGFSPLTEQEYSLNLTWENVSPD